MTEHPILFSGPMVRAVLAGQKTVTRRVMKPQPEGEGAEWRWPSHKCRSMVDLTEVSCLGPYGGKGDHLWLRETWTSGFGREGSGSYTIFAADGAAVLNDRGHAKGPHYNVNDRPPGMLWRPSIFLPRWASRITLEVTGVTVERLQDITEEQAKAEGVEPLQMDNGSYLPRFEGLWGSINAKRAPWATNPWVWAVAFKVVQP